MAILADLLDQLSTIELVERETAPERLDGTSVLRDAGRPGSCVEGLVNLGGDVA
ncbi:MAG: hypothetical protein ACRDZ6_06605 [Acidimicrobiales bacterium]